MTPMSLEEITAISLIKANRLKDAVDVLEGCKVDIKDRSAYLLGIIHARRKDYQKAVEEFREIPADSPYYEKVLPFLEHFKKIKSNPYVRLESGNREEAASIWEKALRQNPNNLETWHNLGILYYWQAKNLEEKGQFAEAISIWKKAIGYWAGLLASDNFWVEWAKKRAKACGVPGLDMLDNQDRQMKYFAIGAQKDERIEAFLSEVTKVQKGVEKQFHNLFLEKARNPDHGNTEMYEQLLLDWNHELNAAHLLERSKKVYRIVEYANQNDLPSNLIRPLSNMLEHKDFDIDILLDTIEQGLAVNDSLFSDVPGCGPMMLKFLNLIDDVQDLINIVSKPGPGNQVIDKLLQHLAPTFTRLRFYLDPELGPLLVIIDVGRYDKAIEDIKNKLQLKSTGKSMARNLKLLLVMACHCQAESLYMHRSAENASQGFKACVEALKVAKLFAFDAISDTSPFDFDIPRLISNLCNRISQSIDRGLISIQEGIHLIRDLCEIAPRGRDAACKNALEALLNREE
jgi:tetratricopeptide (TPR) repeat protein